MFFPALSAVFKERIFSDAKEKLGGKDLDLFAVNSFGSAAQAGFVFLLLPVLCSLRGIDLKDLPQYLSAGKQGPVQSLYLCFRAFIFSDVAIRYLSIQPAKRGNDAAALRLPDNKHIWLNYIVCRFWLHARQW